MPQDSQFESAIYSTINLLRSPENEATLIQSLFQSLKAQALKQRVIVGFG
jgi:hypothetical protein